MDMLGLCLWVLGGSWVRRVLGGEKGVGRKGEDVWLEVEREE